MKKLAVFVEGQTEQIFVEKLIKHISGNKNIAIEIQIVDGPPYNLRYKDCKKRPCDLSQIDHYILIYNCTQDGKVKPAIIDRYDSLNKQNYSKILGLRDIYPILDKKEIEKLIKYLDLGLKSFSIPTNITLAKMELESWFLAEHTHFARVEPMLTLDYIEQHTGFNLTSLDIENDIEHPSHTLKEIYQLVGRSYNKKEKNVNNLTDKLDYEYLCNDLTCKLAHLKEFVAHLEEFFV